MDQRDSWIRVYPCLAAGTSISGSVSNRLRGSIQASFIPNGHRKGLDRVIDRQYISGWGDQFFGNAVRKRHLSAYFVFLSVTGMAAFYARIRHVSTLDPVYGFIAQFVHVYAIAVWFGLLLVQRRKCELASRAKMVFSASVVCMGLIVLAGVMLTIYVSPDYITSWVLPYGQALLVKHLLMLPLLAIAFSNGFLYRYKIKKENNFRPLGWFRAESVIAFFILLTTAFMSQQAPPP